MSQPPRADRRSLLGAAALGAVGWHGAAQSATPPVAGPTTPGLPVLARGLNLSHWFEYERGQGLTAPEMRQLKALGLDHVRIPIDPVVGGWHPQRGGRLNFLAELQQAVAMAVDAGLEVVVDLHLEPADKQLIEDHPETEAELLRLWHQLARAFAGTPRSQVALELFNEPQYYGLKRLRWLDLQRRLLDTVRAQAPAHLVLLTGPRGGAFDAVAGLAVERDPRLAYVFHFYDPFIFTHQGTVWQDERHTTAGLRHGLRYPPDPAHDSVLPLRKPHPRAAQEMADHLKAGWGAPKLRADMARAGQWARDKGVRLLCNEFGCIRANVDPASRYRWVSDVRTALEAAGIGWTLWDYTDIFGITQQSALPGQAGRRSLDSQVHAALGLKPAQGAALK
jgi:endoglucanase